MHMTLDSAFSPAAFVGHAGYILLVLSMLMTRMLWLRIIAIGAGVLQAIYYGVILHDPVGTFWETIATRVNVGQLAIIAYRNRTARFSADERAFYETAVPALEAADARKLIASGPVGDGGSGHGADARGRVCCRCLPSSCQGEVDISINGKQVGDCGAGSFVGEISVSSNMPASATATGTDSRRATSGSTAPSSSRPSTSTARSARRSSWLSGMGSATSCSGPTRRWRRQPRCR